MERWGTTSEAYRLFTVAHFTFDLALKLSIAALNLIQNTANRLAEMVTFQINGQIQLQIAALREPGNSIRMQLVGRCRRCHSRDTPVFGIRTRARRRSRFDTYTNTVTTWKHTQCWIIRTMDQYRNTSTGEGSYWTCNKLSKRGSSRTCSIITRRLRHLQLPLAVEGSSIVAVDVWIRGRDRTPPDCHTRTPDRRSVSIPATREVHGALFAQSLLKARWLRSLLAVAQTNNRVHSTGCSADVTQALPPSVTQCTWTRCMYACVSAYPCARFVYNNSIYNREYCAGL